MSRLTKAQESYLQAVLYLAESNRGARLTDIAALQFPVLVAALQMPVSVAALQSPVLDSFAFFQSTCSFTHST